jgi:hypothetical protein
MIYLPVCAGIRVHLIFPLHLYGMVNFRGRDFIGLFGDPVGDYRPSSVVEELQYTVPNSLKLHSKLVNVVPEVVGSWSPKVMSIVS